MFDDNQISADVTELNFTVFTKIKKINIHNNDYIYGTIHWNNFPSTVTTLYLGGNSITLIDNSTYNKYYVKNTLTSISTLHLSWQEFDMNFFQFWDLLPINNDVIYALYLNGVTFTQGPSIMKWEYIESKFENITKSGDILIHLADMGWYGYLNLTKFPSSCIRLELDDNNLYGELIADGGIDIAHMTNLQRLYLHSNNFNGTVDWNTFTNMTNLNDLKMQYVSYTCQMY